MNVWTQGLNPEQALAVSHEEGPLLILAGAGSGKTTVLVSRTGRLIAEKKAKASEICVLTFTNKAARELKHRVTAKLGDLSQGLWSGTFHAFGLQILKRNAKLANLPNQFGVIDQSDSSAAIKEILKDIRIAGKDKFDLMKILELVNSLRVHGEFRNIVLDEYHQLAELVLPKYLRKLEVQGVVDFEGLLLKPLELFSQHPEILAEYQERFRHVMVDEFQDTNAVQMRLIDALVKKHRNITVVGDDDQSIYGWRGAQISNILDFPKLYKGSQVISLEKNYRSVPSILNLANEIIKQNVKRHKKVLIPENTKNLAETPGLPELFIFENEDLEADFVIHEIQNQLAKFKYGDFAVLYRSNAQGALIESLLRQRNWPYKISGGAGLFDRKEIKDVLAYLRASLSFQDLSLRRIINVPTRGIGDTTVEKINQHAQDNGLSFWKACQEISQEKSQTTSQTNLQTNFEIPAKTLEALQQFVNLIKEFPEKILNGTGAVGDNLLSLLREIGYCEMLSHISASGESAEKRWVWIEILSRILNRFIEKGGKSKQSLIEFLEAMELRDDDSDEDEQNHINLMTLHASKGLEFPVVFLIGIEEDLLPHRTLGADVDEERRLFYVGLTRAKKRLILTRCQSRKRNGTTRPSIPSRFLMGLGKNLIQTFDQGVRPVTESQRETMLADLLSKLSAKP